MDSVERRKAFRGIVPAPHCLFCDIYTEPSIVLRLEDRVIKGWKCPQCGFTLIHPEEIPKAMEFLKETMKLRT